MSKDSGAKFIGRNRAPRVQIDYDCEILSEKKRELPFVMGVMADLSGKPADALPSVNDRSFSEIDNENFDDVLKQSKPRAAFQVDNTLTGEGKVSIDLSFESLDDFSPAAIAQRVEPLRKLLEARTELANLASYMDGKDQAETVLQGLLGNKELLQSLMDSAAPAAEATEDE
ncbi:MAG: type VI secretion system contractile sheath small subunit [Opitutaceae bacterium]